MFPSGKILKFILLSLLIILNIGCDQVSKGIVRENIGRFERIEVVKDHLTITHVENPGAFLSLGSNMSSFNRNLFLTYLPLLILLGGIAYTFSNKNLTRLQLTAFCFIIGGGIGNLLDRLIYGSVTDFLHIDLGIMQSGIFNMADLSIVCGVLLIIIFIFRKKTSIL